MGIGTGARNPRIPPIRRDEWTDEVRDYFRISEGIGSSGGEPTLNVVKTLAHNVPLAAAYRPLGGHLLQTSSLSPRDRELVTLRTAWLCHSRYEWNKHAILARELDFSDADFAAIEMGHSSPHWSPYEGALIHAVDQLKANTDIDDAVWAALSERLDRKQLLDLIFTVGMYAMLAMALNAARVEEEPEFTPELAAGPA